MINELHARFHRPERGWDPVPAAYVQEYADDQWKYYDDGSVDRLLDRIEAEIGPLKGKRTLDLGGGPGQFSVGMAKRGAKVVWHDISKGYLAYAKERADSHGVDLEFSLGYLEDAVKFSDGPFDFVFNRICWYYCANDCSFAKMIYQIMAPNGVLFVQQEAIQRRANMTWRNWVYDHWGVKIGHPYPLAGVVESHLTRFKYKSLSVRYHDDGRSIFDLFMRK